MAELMVLRSTPVVWSNPVMKVNWRLEWVSGDDRWTQGKSGGARLTNRGQSGLLGSLDLRNATVVNDELNHSKAKAFNLLPYERNPIRGVIGSREVGIGRGR
jgi:hypothetical protein